MGKMKKTLLIIFIVSLFTGIATAQSKEKKTNWRDSRKAPEITFKEKVHDYGTIEKGANGIYEFEFKNTGKEPLIIKTVRSSCGCTIPTYPQYPIKKKKTAKIKVKYDTNRMGAFSKNITVYSNAKNDPIVLKIKGKVVNKKR